jgi:cobalt-zinc-cadmium efflux system outer membrane protein
MQNPEFAASSWEVRAAEARALQAGLRPNPEVEVEIEEFGGSGGTSGFDAAATTVVLGQLIELGGKRTKRRRTALLERDLAGWDYEGKRIEVLTETTKAFIDVLSAQQSLTLANDRIRLAGEVLKTVAQRVKAGKVSPVEETKARIAMSTAQIDLENAKRELAAARQGLAAAWGSSSPAFTKASGALDVISPLPRLDQVLVHVTRNPDLARWKTEFAQRRAALETERAQRIPDVELAAGIQQFNETDETAVTIGIGIPLPLFDRNQGGILEAKHNLAKAQAERRATEVRLRAEVAQAYEGLAAAYNQARALKTEVLPRAQEVFTAIQQGYRQGKFGYLDVLDAQDTLIETRGQYMGALATYHRKLAELEGLIAGPLEAVQDGSGSDRKEIDDGK